MDFQDITDYADFKDENENEIHFMLQCPVYESLRQRYLRENTIYTQRQQKIYSFGFEYWDSCKWLR